MTRAAAFVLALACTLPLRAHPEIEAAVDRLNALIAAVPADAGLYLERGELYARHEDWVSAEANYLRAAELSPRLPGLDCARAVLALATGRAAEARLHLDRALALDPRDAMALVLRARARAAAGNRAAALADFNGALQLIRAPSPELFLQRAALIASVPDAVRSLDEGLARVGPVLALQLRALALEESIGRIDAALARLDRIAADSERKESWLKRRGDLLARAGRANEAQAAYAAALAALSALPEWLRDSPDSVQLTTELKRLTSSSS